MWLADNVQDKKDLKDGEKDENRILIWENSNYKR